MHVLIITDLEGISCVDSIDMIPYENEGYQRACGYLMADVNAAVDGAFAGGATKVTVIDGHGGANNFMMELLDKRAVCIPASEFAGNSPQSYGYDALMCVGAHAMAGTEKAFLDHTQSSTDWFEYCIAGKPQGEMAQQAYFLGAFGVPLVMMSGDAAACAEAKELVPNVATACVKEAHCRNQAVCLPQEEALDRIRLAARDGAERYREIAPCVLQLPAEIKLTYCRNDYCDRMMHPGLERNGRTVRKTIEKIETYHDLVHF